MEFIFSGIAILLSLLSFYVARNKASKRTLKEILAKNLEIQKKLDTLQHQVENDQKRKGSATPIVNQAEVNSTEMSILRTEVGYIRRGQQENSQKLSIHGQILESLKEKQSTSDSVKAPSVESFRQNFSTFSEPDRSDKETTTFQSLGSKSWLGIEKPTQDQPAKDFSSIQDSPVPPPEPYEQVAQQYQDAIDRGDRQTLRQLQFKELNITSECEDLLVRGSIGQATKLEVVHGGGSYMVISGEGRYWLFPTAQTLDSFSLNQPQKRIFDYERQFLSKPVVKKPAEVREDGESWLVIMQGLIIVPD
ncbi:MAG: Uncharacterised protein [Prochlorococcus marinus str. MIT 9215]|nr:MAG: Uncharacterised protein [Prochlorococcus marinus str. MIT 9215]